MKMDSIELLHDDNDQEPFLSECQDQNQKTLPQKRQHFRYIWHGILLASVLAHITLLMLWFTRASLVKPNSFILYSKCSSIKCRNYWLALANYSYHEGPFSNVFSTKVEIMRGDAWDYSDYVGLPSERVDDAWHELQRGKKKSWC
jgi:hypothetical protein